MRALLACLRALTVDDGAALGILAYHEGVAVVGREGIEPPTVGLRVHCSTS